MNHFETVRQIMTEHPELGDFGFGVYGYPRKSETERADELAKNRATALEERSLERFGKARIWLSQFQKLSNPNRRGTSYGLKHVAEYSIGYTTNGIFIMAAIAEGFTVVRCSPSSPNAWFNISSKAWTTVSQKLASGPDNAA